MPYNSSSRSLSVEWKAQKERLFLFPILVELGGIGSQEISKKYFENSLSIYINVLTQKMIEVV